MEYQKEKRNNALVLSHINGVEKLHVLYQGADELPIFAWVPFMRTVLRSNDDSTYVDTSYNGTDKVIPKIHNAGRILHLDIQGIEVNGMMIVMGEISPP